MRTPIEPKPAPDAANEPEAEPGRGRPRDQRTHDAILGAARELLRHRGHTRFSIEQVAASAAVSKASIYRRWPTKGALLIELYMEGLPKNLMAQQAGSLRDELQRYLLSTVQRLQDSEWRGILRSLVAEAQHDADTAALLRERVVLPRREAGLALLRQAEGSGQIAPGIDHELILDLLFGPLWYRLLFEHAPLDDDFARRLLRQVEQTLFVAGAPQPLRRRR